MSWLLIDRAGDGMGCGEGENLDSSQAYICPYKYHPVNEERQRVTCENMGLMYCVSNRTAPGGLHIPLTVPASVRSIKGDGNCFFKSISYVITGCEEQHHFVRRAILIHMSLWPLTLPLAQWAHH